VGVGGTGVQVSVGVTFGVGVSSGVEVKVGLRVLVGVGSGARAISELAEQPRETAIATKGRISNRIDFVCTKKEPPICRLNASHFTTLSRKDQNEPLSGLLSAFAARGKDFTKGDGYAMILVVEAV
jgi:hypothetical protein